MTKLKRFVEQLHEAHPSLAEWARGQFARGETEDQIRGRLREALALVEVETAERLQLFKDTLTNWIDTSCGLWACVVERAKRDDQGNALSVVVQDAEDEDEPIHTVTLDTVRLGFARVMGGNVKALHPSYIGNIAAAYATNDGGMIDANDSDIILQAGIFNEVIYG